MRPALAWSSNALLSIASFGLDALKDDIYRDIARGSYDRPSMLILLVITLICLAVPTVLIELLLIDKIPRLKSILMLPEAPRFSPEEFDLNPGAYDDYERQKVEYRNLLKKQIRLSLILLAIVWTPLTGSFMFSSFRTLYVVNAVTQLQQARAVVAPYLSEQERLSLVSRSALIANKEDFDTLMNNMKNIALQHGITIPTR